MVNDFVCFNSLFIILDELYELFYSVMWLVFIVYFVNIDDIIKEDFKVFFVGELMFGYCDMFNV